MECLILTDTFCLHLGPLLGISIQGLLNVCIMHTVRPWFFQPRPKVPKTKPLFLLTILQNKSESVKKETSVDGFPFELPANQCQPSSPGEQIGWHWLAGNSKGNLIRDVFLDQSKLVLRYGTL